MIYFEHLPLDNEIVKALAKLKIDYVFQPIFEADGETVYAYEALMRPLDKTVTELIDEYIELDQLHVLEVATFWGATQAYFLRGYTEKLSVNSFPCECFTPEETQAYVDYFGSDKNVLIIEQIEYPVFSEEKSLMKRKVADVGNSMLAIDDYGTGFNEFDKVAFVDPQIVKIDRLLLSNIDNDNLKRDHCKNIINAMHDLGKLVVAEGIETEGEFECMKALGADLFQGYYLARPS